MAKFELIVQHPKPQKPVRGVFVMDKFGDAQFFSGDGGETSRLVATLDRARVEHAASHGILISGIERVNGRMRFQVCVT